ncbi:MerR family transcriptional regulator [Phenylobacterium terrae]|uniref:MerR family transcriptional regulator n=1 Tax=Phenylobacterium terrae TaxID=2665495 RepID=A0ABW4N1B1_9CAUL
MERWTVSELARLSGVSVRTLHHYDAVGLLRPACVGRNGYRYYGREELLRLQQILFHRELGLPLAQIAQVLDAPGFDRAAALRAHRQTLAAEAARYRRLVRTIDQTLAALEGETDMDEKDLYRGFAPEKQAEYEDWLVDRFGPGMAEEIAASKAKLKGASAADMARLQAEAEAIETAMAKALAEGLPADSSAVQALMRRHHDWVAAFWRRPPTAEAFAGLGRLYQEHPDFRARYDGRAPGLTDYLAEAMRVFGERKL